MTPKAKLWASIVGLVIAGVFWRRRANAATGATASPSPLGQDLIDPYGPADSAIGVCVSGSTGPTACGGDVSVTWWNPATWFDRGEPIQTITKTEEWTSDPRR